MTVWLLVAASLCLLLGLRAFYRKRLKRGSSLLLISVMLFAASLAMFRVNEHVGSYSPILEERDIVQITTDAVEDQPILLVKDLVNDRKYRWAAKGQEWRLELRTLKLTGLCKEADIWPDSYRLSRIILREEKPDGEVVHSVQLYQATSGWDLWKWLRTFAAKRPDLADNIAACIETGVLSTKSLPLVPRVAYRFSFRRGELHDRRLNDGPTN